MKKPSKKPNTITVSEFKSWMSGVEDMQEAGWVPNKVQWDRIRTKIGLLSEEVVEKTEITYEQTPELHQQYAPQMPPQYAQQMQQMQQPMYYEPEQFSAPVIDTISYISGEKPDFI